MTLPTNASQITYTGNGSANSFAFPYLVEDSSHFKVYHDGVLQATGFTLSGIGTASVTVTYTVAPANGVEILFLREVPLTQESDYVANDPLPAETLEGDFDLATMGLQQLDNKISRTLRAPDGETIGSMVLGNKAARANKYIQFDANGLPTLVTAGPDSSGGLVTSSSGTTARSLAARFDDVINVKDFGAAGDGTTDDTSAINAALAVGGHVFLPNGNYKVTSQVSIAVDNTSLVGERGATITSTLSADSTILITGSGCRLVGFRLVGPTLTDTHVLNERGIEATGASAAAYVEDTQLIDLEITGFGQAGIWLFWARNVLVSGCHIHRMGKYGIAGLSTEYGRFVHNYIHNMKPGQSGASPFLNAYGIILTRQTGGAADDLATYPASRKCIVAHNNVEDIPSWECIDTHGGQEIIIAHNNCRLSAKGIMISHADSTTDPDTLSANFIHVIGNYVEGNVPGGGGPFATGITIQPTQGGARGVGINVYGNILENCGTLDLGDWVHGAIYSTNTSLCSIENNILITSGYIAIELEGVQVGASVRGNAILNVTTVSTVNTGISIDTATVHVLIDGNRFYRSSGSLDAFSFIAPTGSNGVTLGVDNTFFGTITKFKGSSVDNIVGGSYLNSAKAWCTFDGTGTTPLSIDDGFNVTDITKSGTGDYNVNITNAMSNSNYVGFVLASEGVVEIISQDTTNFRFTTKDDAGTATDCAAVHVVIFGR